MLALLVGKVMLLVGCGSSGPEKISVTVICGTPAHLEQGMTANLIVP